jgi:hypothetical protein
VGQARGGGGAGRGVRQWASGGPAGERHGGTTQHCALRRRRWHEESRAARRGIENEKRTGREEKESPIFKSPYIHWFVD